MMKRRTRMNYSASQRALTWDRWQRGESLKSIGRLFERSPSTISREISRNGGYDSYRATQADARDEIESWRDRYNHIRPHRSLGKQPPAVFARQGA